jgi:hypothetical protein
MAKKCTHCGHDNNDQALRCVCGNDLSANATVAPASTSTEPGARAPSPTGGRNLGLRRIVFVLWAIAFMPLYAALRSYLHVPALHRSLIGTGVFCASAVAALWLLGREKQLTLRAWRIFFVLRAMSVTPLLLTVVDGIAEQGWPSGRFNKPIAHLLLLILTMTIPTFLTGLCALIRTYRLAAALAILTGLASLVDGVLLIRATSPFRGRSLSLVDLLDVVMFGSKVETYLSIPMGIALIVGGIVIFRAVKARAIAARTTP